MELEFDNRFDAQFDEWESKYESLLDVIASLLSIRKNYEIDLSLVGEEEIHTINRDYRGIDRVTDVISFAFEDDHSDLGKSWGETMFLSCSEKSLFAFPKPSVKPKNLVIPLSVNFPSFSSTECFICLDLTT